MDVRPTVVSQGCRIFIFKEKNYWSVQQIQALCVYMYTYTYIENAILAHHA